MTEITQKMNIAKYSQELNNFFTGFVTGSGVSIIMGISASV
jgi:hypothetical protein